MMEQSIGNDKQLRQALVALHPIGRAGKHEEIANALVWFLSDNASFVTGHTLVVDGDGLGARYGKQEYICKQAAMQSWPKRNYKYVTYNS